LCVFPKTASAASTGSQEGPATDHRPGLRLLARLHRALRSRERRRPSLRAVQSPRSTNSHIEWITTLSEGNTMSQ
jgi:hypothetical protein